MPTSKEKEGEGKEREWRGEKRKGGEGGGVPFETFARSSCPCFYCNQKSANRNNKHCICQGLIDQCTSGNGCSMSVTPAKLTVTVQVKKKMGDSVPPRGSQGTIYLKRNPYFKNALSDEHWRTQRGS